MIDFKDTDDDEDEFEPSPPQATRKKMLLIILPIVIAIGLLVSFYTVFTAKDKDRQKNYQVIDTADETAESKDARLILYDLPEIEVMLNSHDQNKQYARIKLSLEIPNLQEEKIHVLEAFIPRINDIVTSHLIEIYPEEIQTTQGLYWLKEDLLYRINLVTKPVKINNISIKTLEIRSSN